FLDCSTLQAVGYYEKINRPIRPNSATKINRQRATAKITARALIKCVSDNGLAIFTHFFIHPVPANLRSSEDSTKPKKQGRRIVPF
ncbi:MAG: hypothetical protein AAFO06_21840, partial [Cyanobacteria bacterium J06597_16]